MFLQTPFRTLTISSLTILALSACVTQQAPAPVITGNGSEVSAYVPSTAAESATVVATDISSNPYGATPYTPSGVSETVQNTVNNVQNTATNTVNQVNTQVAKVGTYVGNYTPVDVSAATHTVVAGDTVYNISKRYGISQENLRAWNNISLDNTIAKGQVLHVKKPGTVAVASTTPTRVTTSTAAVASTTAVASTAASKVPQSITNNLGDFTFLGDATTPIRSLSARTVDGIAWQAPVVDGKVIQGYGNGNNGVELGGTRGQPVYAAADGMVIFSNKDNKALRGYGNLVIIQHENKYVSAYGNNESLLVKEGHYVRRGQQIATMGDSDSTMGVRLHFEIRKEGKVLNPINFVTFE